MPSKKAIASAIIILERVWDKFKIKGVRVNAGVLCLPGGWTGHCHVTEYNKPHKVCEKCTPAEENK